MRPNNCAAVCRLVGLPEGQAPTIKTLAERMQLNHNTTVELVDRCQERGFLQRVRNGMDRRVVTLAPTPAGRLMMEEQANASRAELREIGPILFASLQRLMEQGSRVREIGNGAGRRKTAGL